MIELRGTSLVYSDHGRTVYACRDIDMTVQQGEFVGILGPSGSGKSSLLYLMCGLKVPTTGTVEYKGRSLMSMPARERDDLRLSEFGFVLQYPYLIGYLSALENVMVAQPDPALREEALDLFKRLDVADKANRLPHELSGGERQRVCGRAHRGARPRIRPARHGPAGRAPGRRRARGGHSRPIDDRKGRPRRHDPRRLPAMRALSPLAEGREGRGRGVRLSLDQLRHQDFDRLVQLRVLPGKRLLARDVHQHVRHLPHVLHGRAVQPV